MLFESHLEIALCAAGIAISIGLITQIRAWFLRRPQINLSHLRGRVLRDAKEAHQLFLKSPNTFRFGGCHLPYRSAYGHLAIVGSTGSGKTVLQRLLMQSVLPGISSGSDRRALVYDAKQDMLSLLAGMGLSVPVHVFNPLDVRGAAWDMAADVTTPAAALQAATLLIPKASHDANPFFSNAARHLLYGVLLAFILNAPGRWTLRQVLLVLRDEKRLRSLMDTTDNTRYLLQYCEQPATFQNILSTILTRLAPYEIIAAAWDRAKAHLSLRHWLATESVLLLGNDEENRAAIDTLNQLIFKRLSELVLAQQEVEPGETRTTWILLDEVRQAGRLDGLSALMTKGRSKGAAVILGFQDIGGLRELYGREGADELLGQCNHKAILRLNSPETARWASQLIGASEFVETRKSRSQSRTFRQNGFRESGSSGVSFSDAVTKRDLVLDSEFFDLPETSFDNGLSGFFIGSATGVFRDHLTGESLRSDLRPALPDVPNFIPRPESHQYLRGWAGSDATNLCMYDRSLHGVGNV